MFVLFSYYLCFEMTSLVLYRSFDVFSIHSSGVILLCICLNESYLSSTIYMYLSQLMMVGSIFLLQGVTMRSSLFFIVFNPCYCCLLKLDLGRFIWDLNVCHGCF